VTVISDTFADIAGHGDVRAISFWAPVMRDNATGEFIVTPQYVHVAVAPDGSFTSPDLLPGLVRVRINGRAYDITLTDWPDPIRLGPLLTAAEEVPADEEAKAVRNGGGVAVALLMEPEDFAALSAVDPETVYLIPD
jgi:hypothetical protein